MLLSLAHWTMADVSLWLWRDNGNGHPHSCLVSIECTWSLVPGHFPNIIQEDINYLSKMSLRWCCFYSTQPFLSPGQTCCPTGEIWEQTGRAVTYWEKSNSAGLSMMLCPRDWPAPVHSCLSICLGLPGLHSPASSGFKGSQSGSRGWPSLPCLQDQSYTSGPESSGLYCVIYYCNFIAITVTLLRSVMLMQIT